MGAIWPKLRGGHSPAAPTSKIGAVGVFAPSARSTVTPNALAGTPAGSSGKITLALPVASGWKTPAGIGAFPFAGITHSSYALPAGRGSRLFACKIKLPLEARYTARALGAGFVFAAVNSTLCADFAVSTSSTRRALKQIGRAH